MKTFAVITILCAFLLSSAEAQTIYLSAGGGFSIMKAPDNYTFVYMSDRMAWPATFEELTGRRSDLGFSIANALEFRLADAPFTVAAGVFYTQLYGSSDYVKAPTPPWQSTMYTIGELTTRSNILTFNVGLRWHVVRLPVEPYIGLDVLYNILGDTKLTIRSASTTTEAIAEGNTRMGLSFGAGVVVPLGAAVDLRLGGTYALMNLISPDSQEEAMNVANFGFSFLFRAH
jgi:hypothetical protein